VTARRGSDERASRAENGNGGRRVVITLAAAERGLALVSAVGADGHCAALVLGSVGP
jgi:hypothetical protein